MPHLKSAKTEGERIAHKKAMEDSESTLQSSESEEDVPLANLKTNGLTSIDDIMALPTAEKDEDESIMNASTRSVPTELCHEACEVDDNNKVPSIRDDDDDLHDKIEIASITTVDFNPEILPESKKERVDQNKGSVSSDSDDGKPLMKAKSSESSSEDEPKRMTKDKKTIKVKHMRSSISSNQNSDFECSPNSKKSRSSDKKLFKAVRKQKTGAKSEIRKEDKISSKSSPKASDSECSEESSMDDEPLADVRKRKPSAKHKTGQKRRRSSHSSNPESSSESKQKSKPRKKFHRGEKAREKTDSVKGDDPRIVRMKRYVRAVGLHLKYVTLFENCKSTKSKVQKLHDVLEEAGLKGKPTLEKCKRLKKKIEKRRELEELDPDNILKDEPRTRRRTGNPFDSRPSPSRTARSSQPPASNPTRQTFSRLKGIVDSEESSG